MNISERIKQKRLAMNLSEAEVAGAAGLTVSSYGDVELHDDEWSDVQLGQLKLIGDKLQLDIFSLIEPSTSVSDRTLRRGHVLRRLRRHSALLANRQLLSRMR